MIYNISYNIAAMCFLVVFFIYLSMNYSTGSKENKVFSKVLIWVFVTTFADTVTAYTISFPSSVPLWVNYILNSLYFIGSACCAFCFSSYVRRLLYKDELRWIDIINRIVIFIYSLICFTTPFTHLMFLFDENQVYTHGILYPLLFFIPFYFIMVSVVRVFKYRKEFSRKQLVSILLFVALTESITLVQYFLFPKSLISFFGTTLAAFVLMFSLETPDYHALVRTMAELEAAKSEAEEAKNEAFAANQAKSSFLANMSHEIRTPINGILGMNEIALRDNKDPEIEENLQNIRDAGQSLLAIVNDILDFSKLESGKMEIVETDYTVSSILYSTYNLMQTKALDKNLLLEFANNPDIPSVLHGDGQRIQQIIINLLNNGIKYTKEGTVSLYLGCEDTQDGINLIVKVTDTGIGISEENIAKLFQPFQRVDLAKNKNVEGTGLGLIITRHFAELMGGSVSVTSKVGEGSCFTAIIPQKVVNKEALGKFNPNEKRKTTENVKDVEFKAPGVSILVVDDVAVNLKVVTGLLKNSEMCVDVAQSGREAVEKASVKKYDILFLDHMMPELDGYETMTLIKADPECPNINTPVIVLTANAIQGVKEEYMEMGFDDYLAKPINRVLLIEMIKKYLPKDKQV